MNFTKMMCLFGFLMSASGQVLSGEEVQLLYSQFTPYYENGFDHAELEGAIEVKDIGPNKKVILRYQKEDGGWSDHSAFYAGPTFGNYEAFRFRLPMLGSISQTAFAIKYTVNGNDYWDNNNGNNYQFDGNNQTYFPLMKIGMDDASRGYGGMVVTARLHDLSDEKMVSVVYSQDGWQTQQSAEMVFEGDFIGEYPSERWRASTSIDRNAPLEFFVEYTVNGTTYRDNNHGRNFLMYNQFTSLGMGMLKQRYNQLFFRGEPTNWKPIPMSLNDDYSRSIDITFNGDSDFKFDVYADWSLNFGDNNDDGIADKNGENISVGASTTYRITIDEITKAYTVESI